MLAAPERPSVEVRSGQREQLVMSYACESMLYVFSEQGIWASAVHQEPGLQSLQVIAPEPFWK